MPTKTRIDASIREDNDTIRCVLQGDDAAFGRLVHKYDDKCEATIRRELRRCGFRSAGDPRLDIDSIRQETWLAVFKSLAGFEIGREFGPWLKTIARNKTIDAIRRLTQLPPVGPEDDVAANDGPSGPRVVSKPDLLVSVQEELRLEPEHDIELFVRVQVGGERIECVARELGISVATAFRICRRIRNKLKDILAFFVMVSLSCISLHSNPVGRFLTVTNQMGAARTSRGMTRHRNRTTQRPERTLIIREPSTTMTMHATYRNTLLSLCAGAGPSDVVPMVPFQTPNACLPDFADRSDGSSFRLDPPTEDRTKPSRAGVSRAGHSLACFHTQGCPLGSAFLDRISIRTEPSTAARRDMRVAVLSVEKLGARGHLP